VCRRCNWRRSSVSSTLAAYQWNDIVAPYESAAARLLLGQALTAAGHGARGNAETAAAGAMFDRLELPSPPQTAAMPPSPPAREVRASSTAEEHRFCREGDYWSVVFDGRTTRLRDAKGLRYLARLLTQPGREIHAIDLVIEDERAASPHDGDVDREASRALSRDAGEVLDRRAKEAYRRRLAEIESDLEEARQCGDAHRTEQAMAERRFFARELARAVGLGGTRSPRRLQRRAGQSERDARDTTRHGTHSSRASRIGSAPRTHDPHRYVLRLPSGSASPGRLANVLTVRYALTPRSH